MTDGCIARQIRVLPVVLALLAAGVLAAMVFLGAPAISSAAQPSFTCTNGTQTFTGIPPNRKARFEKGGAFTCTKS